MAVKIGLMKFEKEISTRKFQMLLLKMFTMILLIYNLAEIFLFISFMNNQERPNFISVVNNLEVINLDCNNLY